MSIQKIKDRILRAGEGAVFTPSHFLDLGTRSSVDQALSRLVKKGLIRRLLRGLYNYPETNPLIGFVTPSPFQIAKAFADAGGHRLLPPSDVAANSLGLTTQVPAKIRFHSDGPSRTYVIGKQVIKVTHASARTMVGAGRVSGVVFQALRYFGAKRVNDTALRKIAENLTAEDKKVLYKDSLATPLWIQKAVKKIIA